MIRYGGAKNAGGERIMPPIDSRGVIPKRMEREDIAMRRSSVAGAPGEVREALEDTGQESGKMENACNVKRRNKCSNQSLSDEQDGANDSRSSPLISQWKKRKVISTTASMPAVSARHEKQFLKLQSTTNQKEK